MPNTPITPAYPLIGRTFTYRADLPEVAVNPDLDTVVLAPGMEVKVVSAFVNWNGVVGLDMLYVYVPATQMHTHVTPADLGYVGALIVSRTLPHIRLTIESLLSERGENPEYDRACVEIARDLGITVTPNQNWTLVQESCSGEFNTSEVTCDKCGADLRDHKES